MVGVIPAGIQPGVAAALNIAGQAVAHHQNVLPVLHAQCAQSRIKDAGIGLFAAHFLGDEHVLHKVHHAAFRQTAGLHFLGTVADDSQRCHLGKLPQHVQHLRAHQIRVGGQLLQIKTVHLRAVTGGIDGL